MMTDLSNPQMGELQPYEQKFLLDTSQWEMTWKQCGVLVKSGFLPKSINTIEKCVTIVLMGRELGLAPMTALTNISVINGKPTLEAKLMLSLVLKAHPNAHYRIVKSNAEVAEVELGRSKDNAGTFSYTITQAKAAGLLNKDNWRNYPTDMLLWRAIARACRVMFPDVLTVTSHTRDEIEPIVIQPEKKAPDQKPEATPKENTNNNPQIGIKSSTSKILNKILPEQPEKKD